MSFIEVWKQIGKTDYEASSTGKVRFSITKRELSQCNSATGYMQTRFTRDGKAKSCLVHRVVAEAFLGPCPEGKEVNHKDGDRKNNKIDNLEYLTRSENMLHAVKLGLTKTQSNIAWNVGLTKEEDPRLKGNTQPRSEETRKKTSESLQGNIPWNIGLTKADNPNLKGNTTNRRGSNKGKTFSSEARQNMRAGALRRHANSTPEERKKLTEAAHDKVKAYRNSGEDTPST